MTRLPEQPGERIDRARELEFQFDGKPVRAFAGDTIASALFAEGRRTFSRSFKYHRPRGLLCCAGQCPNCLVQVDGAPGVRACTEPVRAGMRVEHMNAVPSLDFDVMRATDLVGRPFTPPGFYYKTFIRPRRLWPLYEKVLRHAAGLGRAPAPRAGARVGDRVPSPPRRRAGRRRRGGRAERRDRRRRAGRRRRPGRRGPRGRRAAAGRGRPRGGARAGPACARGRGRAAAADAPALGYFDGLVPVWQGDTLHQIRAARHVFATGAIEQPLLFAGNDLPGVMLSGGALRLAALYGVRPGKPRRGGDRRRSRDRGRAGAARAWASRSSRWPTCARARA